MTTTGPSLPEHLRKRPVKDRDWSLPTAWLIGTKLLGSLRDIVLSRVVKVDLRTWMTAGAVIDRTRETIDDDGECCYVDFLADTGDSPRLVFQLARFLQQERLPVASRQGDHDVITQLPRGSLLVMGGDIAYPIATHRRLLERVCAPFRWAYDELDPEQAKRLAAKPVTLLAVPGNHDYYDGLRGFEALVHSPPIDAPTSSTAAPVPAEQELRLPGYCLAQHASYFAVALPLGWRLWGLDVEQHAIDERQVAYFETARRWPAQAGDSAGCEEPGDRPPTPPPDRLILVTSRPAFVYQGPSDHADVIEKAMTRLGLTPAFADGTLEDTRVRLDLSGDVHLYERYWGSDHAAMPDDVDAVRDREPPPARVRRADGPTQEAPERYRPAGSSAKIRRRGNEEKKRDPAAERANYASVVSGLGGAFHHPSQVRMGTTAPRAAWPGAEHSAREIGVRLVNPYQVFRAGAVGVVGLAVAMACYFLIWQSDRRINVLDVPFARGGLSPALCDALRQLALVAAIVGLAAAMIALPIGGYLLGRWLATPIREMNPPTWWWPKLTLAIASWGPVRAGMRFLGGNPRTTWLFLTTAPAWAVTITGAWGLILSLRVVGARVSSGGLAAVYVVITILVLGMAFLGALRAGQLLPGENKLVNFFRRLCLFGFGAVIALLVVWTPYAWVRLISRNPLIGALGSVVVILTMVMSLGPLVFRRGLAVRRALTWLGFVMLVAGAVATPLWFARMDGIEPVTSTWHWLATLALVAGFGAYFACLWVGWYFCICLQWNRHGNEAGAAARVTAYGEFLRIKLTADQAEVWAIAVEEHPAPRTPWHDLFRIPARTTVDPMPTARLIDHFTIRRGA